MDGQLDALDLITPVGLTRWCEACGDVEFMQTIHDRDTQRFGHPVCVSMNLTLNHVQYWMIAASGSWGEDEPYPCCHDKHGIHGKKISKPTREHFLDHARADIARARTKWQLHLPSLIKAVADLRAQYGITPDEAPVIPESEEP